jgi:hypothetical protein
VAGALLLSIALLAVGILHESVAAAASRARVPALVQSAAGQGGNPTLGSTVAVTAVLPTICNPGDTLIAMVTIGQQSSAGGLVSAVPAGWQRLFEHSPTDTSPYQGWFALSNCSSTQSVTFSISSPGNT